MDSMSLRLAGIARMTQSFLADLWDLWQLKKNKVKKMKLYWTPVITGLCESKQILSSKNLWSCSDLYQLKVRKILFN